MSEALGMIETKGYVGAVEASDAMAKAKSTDPVKVAAAMDGLHFKGFNGDSQMRNLDHQMLQGLYISKWQKVDKKYSYSVEKTGYTFAPVKYIESYEAATPTTCQMMCRPGQAPAGHARRVTHRDLQR